MKLSVVVPAFNEEKLLGRTLVAIQKSLQVLADAEDTFEVIVCDNNSTDRTADISRALGAMVVFEPVNQISRARNTGAAAATGDWLLFIDADSIPSSDLMADLISEIKSGRVIGGGATVQMETSRRSLRILTSWWNCLSRVNKLAAGSFIFCEMAAFRALGGFSTNLFASEEIDLSRRIKAYGRSRGKKFVILHRHPLLTSARKGDLYSIREMFQFLFRTVLSLGGTLRKREACAFWYDGRR